VVLSCSDAGAIDQLASLRPFELMLVPDQTWASCSTDATGESLVAAVRCNELPLWSPELLELATARARLGEAGPGTVAAAPHEAALLDLAVQAGDWDAITGILDRLRLASVRGEAAAAVTLATAHVIRGAAVADPTDVLRALDLALRAAADGAGTDPVVHFNTAALLERLHLTSEAIHAWNDYLAIDASTGWAAEARTRIRALQASLDAAVSAEASVLSAHLDPQRAREYAIDRLLPSWGTVHAAGDVAGANARLDSARSIGRDLADANGDRVVLDAVEAIDRALQEGRADAIANGVAAYGTGRAHYENARYDDAAGSLNAAVEALLDEPVALRGWAQLYAAGVHVVARRLPAAAAAFESVRTDASGESNPSLWGRASWGSGLVSVLQQDLPLAIARYDSAAAVFSRIGEYENLGGVHFLLMETYAALGQQRQSVEHAVRALSILADRPASQMRHNVLASMGLDLRAAGLAHAAVAVLSEGIDAAHRNGQPKNRVEALARLAVAEMDINQFEAAGVHVDQAIEEYAHVSDRFMTIWSEAELARANARLLRDSNPVLAHAALTTAVDFYRTTNNPVLLFPTLAERAFLALANGDTTSARTDLEEAVLDLGRRTRETRHDPATVAALLEAAAPVFDGLIAIHASRGENDAAFRYAEAAREVHLAAATDSARDAVLRLLPDRDGAPVITMKSVEDILRPRQLLLHTAVLADRVHLWYITRDTSVMRTVVIGEADLLDMVRRFGVLLEAGDRAAADLIGERLHDLLLGQAGGLADVDELVVVPDKALQRIPFAALRDSRTGRYLIEQAAIVVAPSAAFALARAGRRPPRFESVILVGDPSFDAARFPELSRLRSAREEVAGVAALYPRVRTLDGEAATAAAFRDALVNADIVHFAGHARYRADRPDLSYLVFARHAAHDGALFARDIRDLRLSGIALVVLSACETLTPELTRTGGFGALARAFLIAGAPAVVGSLWVVDDRATARFMTSFHTELAAGLAPAEALRAAQTKAIRSGDGDAPMVWAAFRYEGG
jgi:CHAT domain-containing protein